MNDNQRKLLIGVGVVVLLMLLFPPFHIVGEGGGEANVGYAFIFTPPLSGAAQVDALALLIQWVGVGIVGAIAWVVLKNSSTSEYDLKD